MREVYKYGPFHQLIDSLGAGNGHMQRGMPGWMLCRTTGGVGAKAEQNLDDDDLLHFDCQLQRSARALQAVMIDQLQQTVM